MRRLIQNRVGLGVRAKARRAPPHVKTIFIERGLAFQHIFADDIRDLHLGAEQAVVDRADHADEKGDGDSDNDAQLSQRRKRSLYHTHLALHLSRKAGRKIKLRSLTSAFNEGQG